MNGNIHSRRDDLESIMYCFYNFLTGTLPWFSIDHNDPNKI